MEASLKHESSLEILPLSKRLKLATHSAHERVDKAIMALSPFDTMEGYHHFIAVQYQFQRYTAPLYAHTELGSWLTDLAHRCRFNAVEQDAKDLAINPETTVNSSVAPADIHSDAEALGWLYVNEGSNLGAAFLLKYATQLGLSTTHGARHLAPNDSGRGLHWKNFTAQLDAIELSPEQEQQAIQGARNAFQFVETLALAQQ